MHHFETVQGEAKFGMLCENESAKVCPERKWYCLPQLVFVEQSTSTWDKDIKSTKVKST